MIDGIGSGQKSQADSKRKDERNSTLDVNLSHSILGPSAASNAASCISMADHPTRIVAPFSPCELEY